MKNETKSHSNSNNSISPLALWRSVPANAFAAEDLSELHAQMRRIDLVGETSWRLAKMGDPGAALGVAIRVAIKKRSSPQFIDLAMSAVLATAIEGSCAARDFLAHLLKKRGYDSLAGSWVDANRLAALDLPNSSADSAQRPTSSPLVASARARW